MVSIRSRWSTTPRTSTKGPKTTTTAAKLWKTLFPRFTVEEVTEVVPDLVEGSEFSIDEDDLPHHSGETEHPQLTLQEKHDKYATKVDEDVAVFMGLAQRMSLSSLMFILQNNVQAQNFPEAYLRAATTTTSVQPKALPSCKKFRFCELSGGKVRTVVHEIPRVEDPSLWWDEASMRQIRTECCDTIKYFRKYRADYMQSIASLAQSHDSDEDDTLQIEEIIKNLSQEARGMEVHIVKLLGQLKNQTLQAVLQAQRENNSSSNNDDGEELIRQASLQVSLPARTLAVQLAQSDRVGALKASLCRWRRQTPAGAEVWWN